MERIALMAENFSDTDLLADCGNGDREAFETLYNLHQRKVFSVALNFFGGDLDKANDVTQQVFLKIFTRFADFRGEAEFTTWLYRITVNTCIDEQRKTRRFFGLAEFFGLADAKMKQEEKLRQKEISAEVQTIVASLKPKFRLPILLKYSEGLSYEEIAKILDCSIGTVSSRLNRGHKMLAQKLGHLRKEI